MKRLLGASILLGVVVAAAGVIPRSGVAQRDPILAKAKAKRPSAVYPLRVGPTRRYLVDKRGRPFLIVGDSPQSLIVNLSVEDADAYLANRAAAGFNSLWVNLLCNKYTAGRDDGTTYDGIKPFKRPGDLATPNEAYFARADRMLRLAAKYNLNVFLDPIETGGWLGTLRLNDLSKAYAYGRWVATRYEKFPNIVWFNGNDFQSWGDLTLDALVLAVARGIQSVDKRHIQTVELDFPTSGSRDDPRWTPIIGLDAAYTYYPTYAQVLTEYNRADYIPTFMVEANYEFEHDYKGPLTLRRQEYWTMLSGATGQLYGSKYTWQFLKDWKRFLDTKPVAQLSYVTKLFASRAWYRLVPDQEHTLVTAGYGQYSDSGSANDSDYVTAARTPDGRLAMAYLPTRRSITVDLAQMAGPARAQWYDPTAGTFAPIAGSPFAATDTRVFVPPERNHDGNQDWVFVLTSA